jgi:adiponectin receptor
MSVRLRRIERRFSVPDSARPSSLETCRSSRPYSLEALDLSTASPIETLASLRFLVLSYLADLEARLSRLASPISDLGITEVLKAQGESTIEEGRAWAKVALEMLDGIRADVLSHFPESYFANISVDNFVKSHMPEVPALHSMRSHLPEMPDVRSRLPEIPNLLDIPTVRSRLPDMPDVRSHLPDMPDVRSHLSDMYNVRSHLPDMPTVRSRLPDFTLDDMRSKLDGVRTRLSDLDFNRPLSFIPTLYERLQSLHSHLLSMEPPSSVDFSSLAPSALLSDLLGTLRQSEIISDLRRVSPDVSAAEDLLGRAAKEIASAVRRSLHGARLIRYADLPSQWRNNPFVRQGYR